MNRIYRKGIFIKTGIALILVYAGRLGFAQDSLDHYLSVAARSSPAIIQKYNEYEAALQKIPQAGALSDPEFTAGVFLKPMELVTGNQVAEFQLMQMFPWFGTLRAAKDEMSLMANASYESFRDTKLQVLFEVQKTWYDLYRIINEIRITEENLELLLSIERITRIRFVTSPAGGSSGSPPGKPVLPDDPEIGTGTMQGMQNQATGSSGTSSPSVMQRGSMESAQSGSGLIDLYNLQIEIGDMQNAIALLKNRLNSVTAQFNAYLNRPALNPVHLPDTLITDDSRDVPGSSIPDSLLVKNPMMAMLNYEKQSLEARIEMVKKMGYPMLGIGVNYSVINRNEMLVSDMNGKDMIMPMASITLPVYRKKYKAMQKEADWLTKAKSLETNAAANSLNSEYYLAVQLYDDAARRIKLYSGQVTLSRKSLNIMMQAFSTSGSGLTEILRLQQKLLDYDYRQVEAISDYNTALAWVRRILGK